MVQKKGVQLTMQTIIISALVLIVLIVLIVFFTKGSGIFRDDIGSCKQKNGECSTTDECTTGVPIRVAECGDKPCCIDLGKVGEPDNQDNQDDQDGQEQ